LPTLEQLTCVLAFSIGTPKKLAKPAGL